MKIGRFNDSGKETFGFIKNDHVITREEITYQTGVPLPYTIKDFLFDGWYDEIIKKSDNLQYDKELSKFNLLAPISNPSKIICLAYNYIDHAHEQKKKPSDEPVFVIKPRTALTGTKSEIKCPQMVKNLDYEVELAIVIGENCKNVDEDTAMEKIFGYTILNDVSARVIQFQDKQFTRAKSFDTFAPCGPWITTSDEIENPQDLKLTTKINGELRQNSSTSKMHLKIPEIISKLSNVMTLEKGDIISTGTPEGVVMNNSNLEFLKDGDLIEMEIENLGKLENSVKIV